MAKNKDVVRASLTIERGYVDTTGIDKSPQDKFELNYRCDNARGGHNENNIMVTRYSDGSMSLADDNVEDFIYLYPQQIKHLKKILSMRPPSKFRGTKKRVA